MDAQAFFTKKRNVIFFAILTYFLWGSAFPSVKLGYELLQIKPSDFAGQLVFAGIRFFLAGSVILCGKYLLGYRIFAFSHKDFCSMALFGILMTMLQYIFFYAGIAHTSGVKASIITGTTTFFSVILAHFFFKGERLTSQIALGCLVGFSGVVLVNFHEGMNFSITFGELLLMVAAFILALGGIVGKILSYRIPPDIMTGWQLTIGGGLLLILGFAMGGSVPTYTAPSFVLMIYLIFISSAAFSLLALLLKYNSVGMVTIFNFLTPVFGVALSGIFLGDQWLEWKNLFALLLVCLGIFFVTSVTRKKTVQGES